MNYVAPTAKIITEPSNEDASRRRDVLRVELARRLADARPALDGEAVFTELAAQHAARFGSE